MPEVSVSIHAFGIKRFDHKMDRMAWRASNAEPVMREIGEDFIDIVEQQFETEGKRSGHPWKKLAYATVKNRGNTHPILIHTGDMFDAIITPTNLDVSDTSVKLDLPRTQLLKAEAAQYGFTGPGGDPVPPRRIVDFTKFDRESFRHKITNWLVNGTT